MRTPNPTWATWLREWRLYLVDWLTARAWSARLPFPWVLRRRLLRLAQMPGGTFTGYLYQTDSEGVGLANDLNDVPSEHDVVTTAYFVACLSRLTHGGMAFQPLAPIRATPYRAQFDRDRLLSGFPGAQLMAANVRWNPLNAQDREGIETMRRLALKGL